MRAIVTVFSVGLLGLLGCGPGGPKVYSVKGRVEVVGGDPAALAGHHVEAALQDDPSVRASGAILEDGSFQLESIQNGVVRRGAVEGTYQVRIVLEDDDKASFRRASELVPQRFLDFRTSALSLQVPAEGEVILRISR